MNITKVTPSQKDPKQAFVHFDIGTAAWSPDFEMAKKLEIGKPVPEGWTLKDGTKGKMLLPPKEGRDGGSAFRNSREGMLMEQASIHRSVALEWACRTYGTDWHHHFEEMLSILDVPEGPRPTARELGSAGAAVSQPSAQGSPSGTTSGEEGGSGHTQPSAEPPESGGDDAGESPASVLRASTNAPEGGPLPVGEEPPSRRTCLHTKGMERRGKYNCCIECGRALEKVL